MITSTSTMLAFFWTVAMCSLIRPTFSAQHCERLSQALHYDQSDAPTGVVDVEINWSGAELHRRVGDHIVSCTVTRLAETAESPGVTKTTDEHGREVVSQCYEVPFTISDVDEWELRMCLPVRIAPNISDDSADAYLEQINKESRNAWELSTSKGPCPSKASTFSCCDEDGQSVEGRQCRSQFSCPSDPCSAETPACDSSAVCRRTASPLARPNHICECPEGSLGNGKSCPRSSRKRLEPKVKYDGATPTEETRRALEAGAICGCNKPTVDVCDGFPKCPGKHEECRVNSAKQPQCACEAGFKHDEKYGCVDETPPILKIRQGYDRESSDVTYLTQGNRYEELGVDIVDDNAEEYHRSLKISYSRPLPQGCLLELAEFYVDYTVATPWTEPEFVRARRTVVIQNVNECKIKVGSEIGTDCPELVARCDVDDGAKCLDLNGSYSCQCPDGTAGDGFKKIESGLMPEGYNGGSGCRDITPPVIRLLGPNPKKFQVGKAGSIQGVLAEENEESVARAETLLALQRSSYGRDLKDMIEATAGAELCATSLKPKSRPGDCIAAYDSTFRGKVDLTSRVVIGEAVQQGPLSWRVPYDVSDDAGNEATTVWRDVEIEEVELADFKQAISAGERSRQRHEIDNAVKQALESERSRVRPRECPVCSNCIAQEGTETPLTANDCTAMCKEEVASALSKASSRNACAASESLPADREQNHLVVQEVLLFLENTIGFSAMMLLLVGCTVTTALYILQRMVVALFYSTGANVRTYYYSIDDEEQDKILMQNVSYYRSPTPSADRRQSASTDGQTGGTPTVPRPPRSSLSSIQRIGNSPYTSPFRTSDGSDNIYQSATPITPRNNVPRESSTRGR
ncbi:hypothetical protein THAOC_36159, partial [Thalassiosira oceanica]